MRQLALEKEVFRELTYPWSTFSGAAEKYLSKNSLKINIKPVAADCSSYTEYRKGAIFLFKLIFYYRNKPAGFCLAV